MLLLLPPAQHAAYSVNRAAGLRQAHARTHTAVRACCPALQTALAVEREERVAEDDEIVAAVNDYTRALQDGLRIIANN